MAESGMSTNVKLAALALFFIFILFIDLGYNAVTQGGGNQNTTSTTIRVPLTTTVSPIGSEFYNQTAANYSSILTFLRKTFNSTNRLSVNYTEEVIYPNESDSSLPISYNYNITINKYYNNISYTYVGI